jgi:hypothetical protein
VDYPRVGYPTTESEWRYFFGKAPRVVGSTFDQTTRTVFVMILTDPWPYSKMTIFGYRVK